MNVRPGKARLIALGVIAIVLGGFTLLGGVSMFFGMWVGMRTAATLSKQPDNLSFAFMALPAVYYLFSATSLVWLGVGTILARRWARALMIVLSWLYLTADALLLIGVLVALAKAGSPPHAAEWIVMGFTLAFSGLFAVGLPIVFIALYSSRQTGEVFDAWGPRASWTDRCPLPVLAVAVLMSGAATLSLLLAAVGTPLPIGGGLWNGAAARVGYLLAGLVFGALTAGSYHLRRSAWWGATLLPIACLASAGFSIRASGDGPTAVLVGLGVLAAGWAGYLAWVRRRFTA